MICDCDNNEYRLQSTILAAIQFLMLYRIESERPDEKCTHKLLTETQMQFNFDSN